MWLIESSKIRDGCESVVLILECISWLKAKYTIYKSLLILDKINQLNLKKQTKLRIWSMYLPTYYDAFFVTKHGTYV